MVTPIQLTSKETVYHESTYHLFLTPQEAHQAHDFMLPAQKKPPYQSLDLLVDEVMKKRYGKKLESFSTRTIKKLRHQIAHSCMERPNQNFSMKIQLPLAKAQDLLKSIQNQLQKIVKDYPKEVDLTPFVEFVFSDDEPAKLTTLLSSNLEDPSLCDTLFKEVCKIREDLHELTRGTTKFIRHPPFIDGSCYINHEGETKILAQTIPSSYDRDNPNVQNGRFNLNSKGHVIYSTGRIETLY